MVTLDPNAGYLVLINTFEVQPERADELLEVLSEATEHGMRQRPGFISANLHVSLDRKHVAPLVEFALGSVDNAVHIYHHHGRIDRRDHKIDAWGVTPGADGGRG